MRGDGWQLRPWGPADAAMLVDGWTDGEVARWNPVPNDPTIDRARGWIVGWHDRLASCRALDLVIERDNRSPGALQPTVDNQLVACVGEVGLSAIDPSRRAAMIGYWLLPAGRGHGLASQAVTALSEWSFETLGLELLVARCATANLASQRVARRAGFHHQRRDPSGHELWVRRAG